MQLEELGVSATGGHQLLVGAVLRLVGRLATSPSAVSPVVVDAEWSPVYPTHPKTHPVNVGRMADNAIVGTSWVVQELGGATTSDPKPELAFGDDGRLTGTTGVNRVMGRYEVAEGLLTVADAATTRMAGPPEAMEQEQRLLALLDTPRAFVVTGDRLELGDGETLAVLVRPSVQPG